FFFQAEDGIRDDLVTGVQTCALPIFAVEGEWRATVDVQVVRVAMTATGLDHHDVGIVVGKGPFEVAEPGALMREQGLARPADGEIGRASCRERVEVGGGAGTGEEKWT